MLTRRQALASTAALPLAVALPAQAAAPMLGASSANIRRVTLGGFEVTTMLSGMFPREDAQSVFGMNVPEAEFDAVADANFVTPDFLNIPFTPTIVNTGSELVLFDTSPDPNLITASLASAGYTPDQVDVVVITHMHGDHIGGLMMNGSATFPNARHITGAVEFDHWAAQGNDGFEANVRPLADQFTMIGDGDSVASGITGMAAFGHTPGHMIYRIESEGQGVILFADLANHPVFSLAHPDWEVLFDTDKEAAAASRRRLLTMMAEERLPTIGYHMPFPAFGYVAAHDGGFVWVAESGQLG